MAKEDFCFTYYDGDAARDTTHMNRLERGAYHDIILCQRKFGRLTKDQIRKVLGKDFEECWPAIELILKTDGEKFFIEWLDKSIEKMREHSTKQKENVTKRYQKSTKHLPKTKTVVPLEDGNGDGYGNEILNEYENWTQQIIDGNDHLFDTMFTNEMIPAGPNIQYWILDHRDLLNRYPKMRPPNQQAFRQSCIKHIRENYKKQPNGKSNSLADSKTKIDQLIRDQFGTQ